MKQKFLSILSGLLFSAIVVNAQDATTYRGAFAPAPVPMWTDNWTNWDPQNTYYPAATVTLPSGTILSGSVTWTRNNTYKLQGLVFVDSLATLTIEAGTVIRGDETVANSSLVVQRGGKLIANGTACNPIVFTSNRPIGSRAKADWGGVILLGRAKHNLGTQNAIEGVSSTDPNFSRVFHGGTNDADNSGSLKYVRIEFGGYVFAPNSEINGLTFGSVGSGTTIDFVQTSFINDDAFEWFGGSVNCKHLVSYRNLDDDLDTDNGFSGIVQYALCVRDPAISDDPAISTSEGFESDNNATGSTATPKTTGKFYNITQIGAFRCANNAGGITQPSAVGFRRGARIRRNSELKIYNSILMNNWRGLIVDATIPLAAAEFRNNIIAMDTTIAFTGTYAGVARIGEDALSTNWLYTAAYTNTAISTPCDVLVNAWDFLNPDYRPNGFGSGGAIAGTDLSPLVEIDNGLFSANQGQDFLVDIIENAIGNSNGTITVSIPKPSGWTITVPGLTLTAVNQSGSNTTSNVSGGTLNSNGNWNFRDNGTNILATSKAGISISQGGFVQLGFRATRKAVTPNGTNQSLAVDLSGGGDNEPNNNGTVITLSAN
ncbi:hypothetical protein BH11BAC4_BH11BAC4_04630 [soil metagenome]